MRNTLVSREIIIGVIKAICIDLLTKLNNSLLAS